MTFIDDMHLLIDLLVLDVIPDLALCMEWSALLGHWKGVTLVVSIRSQLDRFLRFFWLCWGLLLFHGCLLPLFHHHSLFDLFLSVALGSLQLFLIDSIILVLLYVVQSSELLYHIQHLLVQLHLLLSRQLPLHAFARVVWSAAAWLACLLLVVW